MTFIHGIKIVIEKRKTRTFLFLFLLFIHWLRIGCLFGTSDNKFYRSQIQLMSGMVKVSNFTNVRNVIK